MTKILSRAKLPLKISRGNISQRNQLAETMLEKFVNKIEPEIKTKRELSLNRVQTLLKDSVPYKRIYVETIKSENGLGNNFLTHCNEYGQIDWLAVELETNERGKITKKHLNSVYHEAWHFFEQICNPKMISRSLSMEDGPLDMYMSFYHKNIYTKKKLSDRAIRRKINNFLNNFPEEDRINAMQLMRYDLMGEHTAYTNAEKYAHENNNFKSYQFMKKYQIVTEELKKLIARMRGFDANK